MVWFRVDDTFAMHDKVMAAGNPAIGLWVRAGAWSMQQLTDGFVPDHVIRVLGTPKERRTLVEVSLWVEAEGGVRFKNWDERQPTKDQVETSRIAAAERQRHARERAKSQRESRRDSRDSHGASHGPPDPTRPDPTLTDSVSGAEGGTKKRAQRLPADWKPTEDHIARAAGERIDLDREAEAFRLHAEANDRRIVNWNAAFSQWLLKARPAVNVHPLRPPGEGPDDWMRRRR